MKKLLLFLFFLGLLILPLVAALPVTYYGVINYSDVGSTNEFKAVSTIGTTSKQIEQTSPNTTFVLNHMENPDEKVEFYFNGMIVKRYIQPLPASIIDLETVLIGIKDNDKDGIADKDDTCPYVYDLTNNPASCANDQDGDGINDSLGDALIGDESQVTTNIPDLGLEIGGSTNTSQLFNNEMTVEFTNGTDTIVEFKFDFSKENLTTANITIQKQDANATSGGVVIAGINLVGQGKTKTVYVDRLAGEDYICVKDAEIASISELPSVLCTGTGETAVPCSIAGSSASVYTCTIIGNKFKVEGLSHSGVRESSYAPPAPAATPSGGGGGGGGCTTTWNCSEWGDCIDGKQTRICTKLKSYCNAGTKPIELQGCQIPSPPAPETNISTSITPPTPTPAGINIGQITGAAISAVENLTGQDVKDIAKKGYGFANRNKKIVFSIFIIAVVLVFLTSTPFTAKGHYRKAEKMHRKAEIYYNRGNFAKANALFNKAQIYREKGESKSGF